MIEITQTNRPTGPDLLSHCQNSLHSLLKRKDLGFLDLPHRIPLWQESQKLGNQWRERYQQLVVLGIGGSSLGVRTLIEVFNVQNVIVLDNVDGIAFQRDLEHVKDWEKTGWAVISKSGTTIETLCALEFVQQIYKEKGIRFDQRVVVISETTENSLGTWAHANSIPHLEIPKDVGGRYSVLSPVGMFPAAYMGLDLESLRLGALSALKNTTAVTQLMAQFSSSFQRQEWITNFWFYSSRLKYFGMWWMQLWAESLAKKTNRHGKEAPRVSTPISAIGATDQHSVLQQVMEGAKDKFVVFWQFEDTEKAGRPLAESHFPETKDLVGRRMGELLSIEAEATCQGLNLNGISTMTLKVGQMNEESLGHLLMLCQVLVGGLGELLEINAFDQPGVELGKKLAKEKLRKI